MKTRWFALLTILLGSGLLLMGNSSPIQSTAPLITTFENNMISGVVYDEEGPLDDAIVIIQATSIQTVTDSEGRFFLMGMGEGIPVTVSAWKHTYYSRKVDDIAPPHSDVEIHLERYQTSDNPEYEWIPPMGDHESACGGCHTILAPDWMNNAHAGAATNPRFLTIYNGTDIDGNQSPSTRYGYNRDYGPFPLPPDPTQPYYGPGYRLDFPDTTGNCAACHTPGAAVDAPYDTDPTTVRGADEFGIHCDFCHKVADVRLDAATGLPYPNMPGVLSMDIRRPFTDEEDGEQLFFGTFADVNANEGDTYLPLIEESAFCAPCHFGVFWDTVIYNSFGEWLDSPYSDPEFEGNQACQQCHMPTPYILSGEIVTNVAPGFGGIERDPTTIHAHTQPGAADVDLLQDTAELVLEVEQQDQSITVTVTVTNTRAGHHIPTDSPLRQIFLVISATDTQGNRLELEEGETLPTWAGNLADEPGIYFAKILQEIWTEITPTGSYWSPTRILEDTRLPALESETVIFTFTVPPGSEVNVEARLIFRRAFYEVAQQKGWDVPDILMETATATLP